MERTKTVPEGDWGWLLAWELPQEWAGQIVWPEQIAVRNFSPGELIDRMAILRVKMAHASSAQRFLLIEEYRALDAILRKHLPGIRGWEDVEVCPDWIELGSCGAERVKNCTGVEDLCTELAWQLYASNARQWDLEDAAEVVYRDCVRGEERAYADLGRIFAQIRRQNQVRVELRRRLNALFRCQTSVDCRVYSVAEASAEESA